jgi:1-acyl-sn-glycerol-3-phosphate acyltransferase
MAIATAASLLYWLVGASMFLILLVGLSPILPTRFSRAIGQTLIHAAFNGFTVLLQCLGVIRVTFTGFEKWIPSQQGQILAPNHPALWDAVFILGRVNRLTCILKSSLLRNPLLLGGARLACFIPGTPTVGMVRESVAAVKKGQNLLLFPEATRTRRHENMVNELKGAVGIISQQTLAPIWPIVVQTDSTYLTKGWPLWRWPRKRVTITITLLSPIVPAPGQSAKGIVAHLREAYVALLSIPDP